MAGIAGLGAAASGLDIDADASIDTRGWPSLLDALPPRIRAAAQAGHCEVDLSPALRDAVETGLNFVIPAGIYPIAGDAIELRNSGQCIVGTGGVLRRLPERDGIGLLVSGKGIVLRGLRLNGTAPMRARGHQNDMVKVTGSRIVIVDLAVLGAAGSNLRIDRANTVDIVRPVLTDAYQNNLIICNGSTRDIRVTSPVCRRTTLQNNIFVTASEGSTENGETVFAITISDPTCSDAGDTGIELGYHCFECQVSGGYVSNSTNPALLQRDGKRNLWKGVLVDNQPYANQHKDYDGVAVTPQWEGASWQSETEFRDIVVRGPVRRSAFYWGQSGIRRIDCTARANSVNGTDANPITPTGSGDLKSGAVGNIIVKGGVIDGFATGDNWNFDGRPYRRIECSTTGVEITRCVRVFNCYNTTPIRCVIANNAGIGNLRDEIWLVSAQLMPSDGEPGISLVYDNNHFSAVVGHAPLQISLPVAANAAALLLSPDSSFVKVGAPMNERDVPIAQSGAYSLFSATARLDFRIVRGKNTWKVVGPGILQAAPDDIVQVTVENDRIVLHQRGKLKQSQWMKLSGPGLRASQPV
ncbi:hypothetical protein J2X47_004475 [Sphingomonas sp. BE270]|nr:hypothetical protein [Sphingomonas sp. BE270]